MLDRDEILRLALSLSREDRGFLATALAKSLVPTQPTLDASAMEHDDSLITELRRRSAAYRTGEATARPAREVLDDLRRRQHDSIARPLRRAELLREIEAGVDDLNSGRYVEYDESDIERFLADIIALADARAKQRAPRSEG